MISFPSISDCVTHLHQTHEIISEISCDYSNFESAYLDLYLRLSRDHRTVFEPNQRLIITIEKDFYHSNNSHGMILELLQSILCDIDISNFFVCLVTTNPDIDKEYASVHAIQNQDPVPINIFYCQGDFQKISTDHDRVRGKIQSLRDISNTINNLDAKQRDLLFVNDTFCIMPWVGAFIGTDSIVQPCCMFDKTKTSIGNLKNNTLKELWNSNTLKDIRKDLLGGRRPEACHVCYQRESLGRDSLRKSVNRDFAHQASIIDNTIDGHDFNFLVQYWDVRYNNLCNFACRSCTPVSSTSWYQIHNAIYPNSPMQKPLLEAGDDQDQTFREFYNHLDHVKVICFAGGEPTMIENFYHILDILDNKKRYDVHLRYNINLSKLKLKDWDLSEIWQRFPNVSIGASLDAMESRAEYLRVGTVWNNIVKNRKILLEKCPHIDFYISATTSLINALHVADFHRSWVDQGLIKPEDFNIQILTDPKWMSTKNAPIPLKNKIIERYQQHLVWLKPLDSLGRATSGFQSIIELCRTADTYDRDKFWFEINRLDHYHGTNLLEYFPELQDTGLN